MRHMKRQTMPKSWPVPRKGNKYVVRPNFGNDKGLPILIMLRDILGVAKTRKEVKKALHEKNILINGKAVSNEKNVAVLFDIVTIKTLTGRLVTGRLKEANPPYKVSYGDFVPEILKLREIIHRDMDGESNE